MTRAASADDDGGSLQAYLEENGYHPVVVEQGLAVAAGDYDVKPPTGDGEEGDQQS